MNAGKVDALVILGGNPVFTAPADLDFTGALSKVATRVHLGLYDDETAESVPLARAGSALPRELGRRAGLRRHGVDDPAAHCAALRRTSDDRSSCALQWIRRHHARRSREGLLDPRIRGRKRRRSGRSTDADGKGFKDAGASGATGFTTGSSAAGLSAEGSKGSVRFAGRFSGCKGLNRTWCNPANAANRGAAPRRTAITSARAAVIGPAEPDRDRDRFPSRPDHSRRPLLEQRLAAGAAEAAVEGHLGQRRVHRAEDGRQARHRADAHRATRTTTSSR